MSATSSKAMTAALAQADVIIDRGLNAAPLSPFAKSLSAHWLDWYCNQPSFSLTRREEQALSGHGATRQQSLEESGVLVSYADGSIRRITTRSIARRQIALAILSHPIDGPTLKIRQPSARFKPRRREPTPQELEGLRRGNAKRAEEARKRREAKISRG